MSFIRYLLVFWIAIEVSAGDRALSASLMKLIRRLPPTDALSVDKQRGLSLKLLTSFIHESSVPRDNVLETVGDLVYQQKFSFYRQMPLAIVEETLDRQYFDKLQTAEYYDNLSAMTEQGLLTKEMVLSTFDGRSVADNLRKNIIESSDFSQYLRDSSNYLQRQLERLDHVDSLTDQQERRLALAKYLAQLEQETIIKHLTLVANNNKGVRRNLEKTIHHVYLNRLTDYEMHHFFDLLRKTILPLPPNFVLKKLAQDHLDNIDYHHLKTSGISAVELLKEINYPLPTQVSSNKILMIINRYIDKDKYRSRRHIDGKITEIRVFAN